MGFYVAPSADERRAEAGARALAGLNATAAQRLLALETDKTPAPSDDELAVVYADALAHDEGLAYLSDIAAERYTANAQLWISRKAPRRDARGEHAIEPLALGAGVPPRSITHEH